MSFPALLCLGRNYTLDLWLLQSLCINFFLNTWEWVGKDRLSELGFPVALGSPHLSSLGSMLHTWIYCMELSWVPCRGQMAVSDCVGRGMQDVGEATGK